MASYSISEYISTILTKPNKTTNDLEDIVGQWNQALLKNEDYLRQYANQLNQRQQSLDKTTESFIQTQDLLTNLEEDLQHFQVSIQTLTKYNKELESNIDQLNSDSKTLLPKLLSNDKTEQERSKTYELMESVDNRLDELDKTMKKLSERLQINKDVSVITTVDELQTCLQDIHDVEETIKKIKL